MSAKITIAIGDYSNGWNDAIAVQDYLPFKQSQLAADRRKVNEILSNCLYAAMDAVLGDPKLNPKPADDPCCDKFEEWGKTQEQTSDLPRCPYCGMAITQERKNRFFTK